MSCKFGSGEDAEAIVMQWFKQELSEFLMQEIHLLGRNFYELYSLHHKNPQMSFI
jgi:hypothetical protein